MPFQINYHEYLPKQAIGEQAILIYLLIACYLLRNVICRCSDNAAGKKVEYYYISLDL